MVLRSNFLYVAITLQIYEWLDTWLMIRYQKSYDVTNVHI